MRNSKTYSLTLIAIGAAIIAVLSPFTLPLGPVPITLQTLAVGLIATVLKARETFFAVFLYLILGFIGLPVFAGGTSGIFVLFSPTGGYLLAFLVGGTLISWALNRVNYQLVPAFVVNILGHLVMLVLGTVWLKFVSGASWATAFTIGVTPFLFVEIAKAIVVTIFGLAVIRALQNSNNYFTKA
ncbi:MULTISPECIES: biotin transporter BioY [unclassified Lactococcus]|uniref:biotin transporter BioY n=1 Tax=unclassified Lactococcus TaxID=2643510 RepID=UPI0011C92D1B|nr:MULTISPECIES: biotin transporter BioY [unclassified Lactococcus]MQW23712.1 BioY family transporter [Lactococcus sp. dk101]TXK37544.1 biotin transporter BioY [Lactococcus sp. dk310]TXK48938.1 biotin transporter BioY [Lactococcus sp. dk322]